MNDASEDNPLEEVLEEVKEQAAKVMDLLNEPNLPIVVNEEGKTEDTDPPKETA